MSTLLNLTVLANRSEGQPNWLADLKSLFVGSSLCRVSLSFFEAGSCGELGEVVVVDAHAENLSKILEAIDRRGRAVILVLGEKDPLPKEVSEDRVDDVLMIPFRLPEVLGKFRIYQQILMRDEVVQINASFSGLIEQFHNDLRLAERLQKAKLPTRFKDPRGFRVKTKYLAGLKSGGEYFDLADAPSGDRLSLLLTDSSTYGLSSAVLSVLMRVANKINGVDSRSSYESVKLIFDEIMLTLGDKDRLSLFYGSISRKDLTLKYLNLGTSWAYHAPAEGEFRALATQGQAISKTTGLPPAQDIEMVLKPADRLVLLSDGFVEAVGGSDSAQRLLNRFRKAEAVDALNEFTFAVKSKLQTDDDMPEQDCTGVIMDVDTKFIRLARA